MPEENIIDNIEQVNIHFSEEEMNELGITVRPGEERNFSALQDGTRVWSLAQTNYREQYPETYEAIMLANSTAAATIPQLKEVAMGRLVFEPNNPAWSQASAAAVQQSGQAQSFRAPVGEIPAWARVARGGYEVSSAGDARFSALNATFAQGTLLGDVDISGRTIEDVYQNVIKRSGKGLPPASDSILYNPDLKTDQERQDFSYENGYLPLWSIWADQNRALVAELARVSRGQTLTDRFAATAVSQARALSEIIRGTRAYFDDDELARISPSRSRVSERALRDYDVFSLGIGKRSIDEFRALIPEGVTMVVDTRHYTSNRFVPEYRGSSLQAMFAQMGAKYTWARPLSGVPAEGRKKEDADWRAVTGKDDFQQALAEIAAAAARGEKVLLIGSDGNPEFGPRALLDALELERGTDIRVGHIDTTSRGPRVRSTEEIVKHVLGRQVIHNGDYLGVHFDEKRRVVALDEGTNLIRTGAEEDVDARLISGNWNYSTPVEFFVDTAPRTNDHQEAMRSAFSQINEAADYSIIFSAGDSDRDVRDQIGIAGHQGTRIHLPTHREDYFDPDRIAAAAEQISKRISRDLTWKVLNANYAGIDPDNLSIAVGGAHIARVANSYVENMVPGEFSDAVRHARNGGSQEDYTGMKMDDISGISQDDVNHFVTEVFRYLREHHGQFGEEGDQKLWNISKLLTTGQSGAGEAATVAAQSLGMKATVFAPKGWRMTVDDETLRGMDISDKAAFMNRFHLGYRNDVTLQNLQEKLEERDRRSMMRDDGMTGGLTDRQVVVLYQMGFGNTALNDMIEIANVNDIRINSPADMADFIQECDKGYGISLPSAYSEGHIKATWNEIIEMEQASGLTDRQIAVLCRLGLGNAEFDDMLTVAKAQGIKVNDIRLDSPEGLLEFLEDCAKARGAQIPDIASEERIKAGWEEIIGMEKSGGLTARQTVALFRSGFGEAEINAMMDVIKTNNIRINTPAELSEFVRDSVENHGISAPGSSVEERIKAAWDGVIEMEKDWKANGVGYVTPNSPDYPQSLRDMDFRETVLDRENSLKNDGVAAHADNYTVPRDERITRPAVLWYKGDLSLLDRPSVTVTGDNVSTTESIAAARFLGGRLADEDMVLIANMSQTKRGATSAALQEHTEKGGKTVAVTGESIGDAESKEAQEAVVRRGGLVASHRAPGSKSAGHEAVKYAEGIAQVAGSVVGVLDGALRGDERANPASILVDLSKTAFSLTETAVVGVVTAAEKIHDSVEKKKKEDGKKSRQGEKETKAADVRDVKANMEGVREIVDTARNLQETAYLDKPVYDWEIKKADDKKEVKVEAPKVEESADVRQAPVRILTLGADQIAFVPEAQTKVRAAVLEKYPNALFATPAEEKGIISRLRADEITMDGARIAVHGEQKGAAPLLREPDVRTEFFFRDRILRMEEVPNGAMGLADRTTREDNARWFEWMKDRAFGLREEFLAAAGLRPDDRNMRFDNADYLVINRNSIELRRGDDITASIRLTDDGKVKVSNSTRLTDDLSEHYDEEHYPALTVKVAGGALNEQNAHGLIDELREALMERPHSEVLAIAAMTREERDERKEKIDNGFLKVREDNISVAIRDLAEGARLGNVSTAREGESADRLRVLATLMYDEKTARKAFENRTKEYDRQSKALAGIPAENAADREEAERRIDELYQERAKEAARIARIEELKAEVVSAKSLLRLSREEEQITYSVDGGVIRLSEHKVTAKALEAAAAEMERISGELDTNGYRTSAAVEIVNSIREENERKAAELHEKEQRKQEAEAAVAEANAVTREKVVRELSNGVCVVAVTGGMAYADKDLNVISKPYHELSDMTSSFGLAKNEKGQMKLIYPDGREVNGEWLDGISKPSEHLCVVKSDKGYNHLDLNSGKLVSKEWHQGAGSFHEGRSVVQNKEGKYNYIDNSGKPLLNRWVDRASDFKDGVAAVVLNGTKFEVDLGGNVLRNVTQEQKKATEKKQPAFQHKPGES